MLALPPAFGEVDLTSVWATAGAATASAAAAASASVVMR